VALPRPAAIKVASAFHALLYRATRGRLGRRLAHHDVLLLTTVGRASGRPHTVPLLYLRVEGGYVVIASYAGHPRHPDWYQNLVAQPRAEVQVAGRRLAVTARDAEAAERELLWARAVAEYPGYARYQDRTARLIPVVLLQPCQ